MTISHRAREALTAATIYAGLSFAIAVVVFPLAGLNRTLWRYTSLAELGRLQLAVTVTVLLALLATFAQTRLIDISRSLPLLQWFFLVAVDDGDATRDSRLARTEVLCQSRSWCGDRRPNASTS